MIANRETRILGAFSLLFVLSVFSPAGAFEMEMGAVTVADTSVSATWTSVSFLSSFDSTPLVFALPTTDGSDPATLRIRNVTTTGFELVQTEPTANDGPHAAMPTAYLAIEAGVHLLPGGVRVIAFDLSTTSFANRFISTSWDSLSFATAFASTPVVLGSIQTMANESGSPPSNSSVPFMDVGIRNVTATGLQTTLERAESTAGTVNSPERIAILAIENLANLTFVDSFSTQVQLQSLRTPNNIRGFSNGCFANSYAAVFSATPLAVASMNTRAGNNGGWLRRCGQSSATLSLTVDEDTDNDSERSHINETAGVIAASVAFHANFDVDLTVSKSLAILSDPVNGTTAPFAIPESTVGYNIQVINSGSISPDTDTLIIEDDIPPDLSVCVTSTCLAGGPVIFDDSASPISTGITLGAVEYSNDGGATFAYVPVPDTFGFDPLVDAIRVSMTGTLASIGTGGSPAFSLQLAARVD